MNRLICRESVATGRLCYTLRKFWLYKASLASSVLSNPCTLKIPAMHELGDRRTEGWTHRQTDRCYQVHCIPAWQCYAVNNNDFSSEGRKTGTDSPTFHQQSLALIITYTCITSKELKKTPTNKLHTIRSEARSSATLVQSNEYQVGV